MDLKRVFLFVPDKEKGSDDGFCLFDEFTNEVSSNPQYSSELATLLSYMNFMAL